MNAIIKNTEAEPYRHLDPDAIDWSACERRWVGGKTHLRWAREDEVHPEHLILGLHTKPKEWTNAPPLVAVINSQGELSQCLHWDTATKKFLVTRDMMPPRNTTDTVEVEVYPYQPQVFEVRESAFFKEDEGIDDVYFEPGSTLENHYGEFSRITPQKAADGRYLSEAQAYECIDRYNQMNRLITYTGFLKKNDTEYAYIANPENDVKFGDIEPIEKHVCRGRKVNARWSEDGQIVLLDAEGEVAQTLPARIAEHRYDLSVMPKDRLSEQAVEIGEKPFISFALKALRPTAVTIQSQKHYLEIGDYIECKKRKAGHVEVAVVRAEEATERFTSYENTLQDALHQVSAGRGL